MIAFVGTVVVLLIIIFIYWQFKMWKKYSLTYDKFNINLKERYVLVNGNKINFREIDHIMVKELQQPSAWEKSLSRSAYYAYMTEVVFYLKDGGCVCCTFNYKGSVYRALKQLSPYVRIMDNIDQYKPKVDWLFIVGIIVAVILGWMMGH